MLRVAEAQRALPQYEVGKAQSLLRTQLPCLGRHELDGRRRGDCAFAEHRARAPLRGLLRAIIEDPQKTLPGAAMLAKGAELDPRELLAWFNLGNVALLGGDFAAATRHFRAALAIDNSLAQAHFQLARIHLLERDHRAALAELRRGLAPDSSNTAARDIARQLGGAFRR
ncbi:MAG: hypothetical protein CK531_04435 [Gemmatimonadetes bacterium]|nr:MAG: hypothetical protein CK531_04435 [Gemmatimonadota bacterium]